MDTKQNALKAIFSWLNYKEKPDLRFNIPKISSDDADAQQDSNTPKAVHESSGAKKSQGANGSGGAIGAKDTNRSNSFINKRSSSSADNQVDSDNSQDAGTEKRRRTIIRPTPATPVENQKRSSTSDKSDNNKQDRSIGRKPKESGKSDYENKGDDKSAESNIATGIDANIAYLEKAFNHPENKDIIIRRLCIANGTNAFIFYLDGMADRNTINLSILKPLLDRDKFNDPQGKNLFDYVYDSVIETHQLKKVNTQEDAIADVLTGNTGVYVDGFPNYILCETKGYEKRNVDKPQVEGVVKGPQEAFNENLRTNITLIRRILKSKELTTEFLDIGERNHGKCAVLYLNNLVNPAIVAEVKRRIKGIKTDLIMGEGVLEQFIEDSPMSIIPTILSTERPDRTVSHLIEGKVAILVEGTPFALIVPMTIADLLHTPEDTSLRWQYGTFLRGIRLFAVFIASMLPGLYVALTTFHREMIPTDLLIAIAKARENVPFPTIVEVLLMELSFELIREAGIRIPGIIGNTIGIIGALILGQAAVQANLVSPVLIIVVAFTGLGNFAIPDFSIAFGARIMRVFYIILGASLGFYGISLGILILLAFIVSLNSFGIPVFSLVAPKLTRTRDLILRWPVWMQEMRPSYLKPKDMTRQPNISRKWTRVKSGNSREQSEDGTESGRKGGSDEQ